MTDTSLLNYKIKNEEDDKNKESIMVFGQGCNPNTKQKIKMNPRYKINDFLKSCCRSDGNGIYGPISENHIISSEHIISRYYLRWCSGITKDVEATINFKISKYWTWRVKEIDEIKQIEGVLPISKKWLKFHIMSSDCHNLELANHSLNSIRYHYRFGNIRNTSNSRYIEIVDNEVKVIREKTMDTAVKVNFIPIQKTDGGYEWDNLEYDPKINSYIPTFEPCDRSKGIIARSIIYMLWKYKDLRALHQFIIDDLNTLCKWDNDNPPDIYELAKNNMVKNFQGNWNPFVFFIDVNSETVRYPCSEFIKYMKNEKIPKIPRRPLVTEGVLIHTDDVSLSDSDE
jgi:endonuclease I